MYQITWIISAVAFATATSQAPKLTATPMTLKIFDQNFHSNSFCKVILDLHDVSQPDRSVNILTGEVAFHDQEEHMERRTLSAKNGGREISFDASRTKETCIGPNREWHESITDEGEWQKLVQKELARVLQVPTEQHSWVATVWSHVTVDHMYTTALGEKLGLPHHLDQDEGGNFLTPFLHSAFGQYIRMNDDFGPVKNAGYFVLPLDARMAQLAQDEKLFEHIFPLPAMLKVHPSVRVFVDHAGRHPDVDTCGGEELDIFLTPVANEPNVHATQIASDWNAQLHQTHKDAGMRFFSTSSHMVTLDREDRDLHSPTHLDQVVEWLVRDPRVADILLRPRFYTSNQYAASVTQVDPPKLTPIGNVAGQPPAYGLSDLKLPIYDKNIKGQGQIVGVGDSGLDYDACHFRDPQNIITAQQIPQGQTAPPKNFPTHRKVVQYVGYADNIEGVRGGHGTHVAGSVAGKPGESLGEQTGGPRDYDGSAPEAKIAFFDIGRPGERGLRVPQSLQTNFFPPARAVGAFIHTNSWGSNSNAYSGEARDCDLYQFENQDFLVLVAAGNSGANGQGSVGTPATAKNIIGVGASVAPKNSWADLAVGRCTPPTGAQAKCSKHAKLENSMAGFSSSGPTFDSRQQPVVVAPGQNIISSQSGTTPGAKTCDITRMQGTSMATPITAGNAALVRQYFTDGFYPSGAKKPTDARKPTGALIKAAMVNGARVIDNIENIGQPLKRGAAPIAAGTEGLPDTVQGQGLVTLTHSLWFTDSKGGFAMRVLAGFCPTGTPPPPPVNGVPRRLQTTVDNAGCKRQDFLNMENVANQGTKTYTVPVVPTGLLGVSVTLAWSDPPGVLNSRGPALINNLDLKVQDNLGKSYLPTNPLTGTRAVQTRDTVEKVIIKRAELQGVTSLTITVTGTTVPQGPQPFALVAGGAVGAPKPPVPENPPGDVVIDIIEGIGSGNVVIDPANPGGGGADNSQSGNNGGFPNTRNASTFGLLVFANVGAIVLMIIIIIVLKVIGLWCCLTADYTLVGVVVLRGLSLVATIVAFVFLALEQKNIEVAVQAQEGVKVRFGAFWQQILMVAALSLSVVMTIVGALFGVMQVRAETSSQLVHMILLVADSLVALALGAASIATANVGRTKYVFLRQSIAALITMCIFLLIMLVDAAHGFSEEPESHNPKPSQNKTTYKTKPSQNKTKTNRRDAPSPPKSQSRPRPKSTRGEILVALYDYSGQEADELDFEEGARIELVEDHMDGWASGIVLNTQSEGLFPLNYTERES